LIDDAPCHAYAKTEMTATGQVYCKAITFEEYMELPFCHSVDCGTLKGVGKVSVLYGDEIGQHLRSDEPC
jgi:hypothetical protein